MDLAAFRKLRPASQVSITLARGIYLIHRLETDEEVHLYHMAGKGKGFFIELMYEPRQDKLVVVHSFEQPASLVAYVAMVCLPTGRGLG